jgi:hypothetical protein
VPLAAALFAACSGELIAASVTDMETMLVVALMFAALVLAAEDRLPLAGAALGLLLIARIDGALWAALVVVFAWSRPRPGRVLAGLAVTFGPWAIFATLYFGSPIPHTIVAKWAAYVSAPLGARLLELWQLLHPFAPGEHVVARALDLLFLCGLVSARRWPVLLVPALFVPLQVLALGIFAPSTASWHVIPASACFALTCALGGLAVYRWGIQGRWPLRLALPVGLLVVAGVAAASRTLAGVPPARAEMEHQRAVGRAAGIWLRANSAEDATVMAEPIGTLGFHARRYIWDTVGLVSPRLSDLRRRFPGNRWFWESLRTLEPDFVVLRDYERPQNRMFLHGGPLLPPEGLAWFDQHYRLEQRFTAPPRLPDITSLALYRRVAARSQKNDAKN